MAKKIKAEGEETTESKGNFQDLNGLAKEYRSGKMLSTKVSAMKKKLIGHFKDGSITEEEKDFLISVLKRERNLQTIARHEKYLLSEIEASECENTATVKSDDCPIVHHLKKDLVCKFYYDDEYNDNKGKEDSVGRYHVFVPRLVPSRHQISLNVALKEDKNQPVDPSEYPADKTLLHHIILKNKEFERWFDVNDDAILAKSSANIEAAYAF